jgi:putative flippase GtrA
MKNFYIKNREIAFFIICGALSAGIYFAVVAILYEVLKLSINYSYTIAYCTSSYFNFIFNRKFTFKKSKNIEKQFIKYIVMLVFSYVIGLFIIEILSNKLKISIYISSILSIAFTSSLRFLASKFVVYR